MRAYAQIARQYAASVASGKKPAAQWVRAACVRAAREWKTPPAGYVWAPKEAARVCEFCELLPEIKGARAGQRLRLEPWQVFLLSQVFGWQRADGTRRHRRAYVEVPRGNGKSTLSAAVALYMLCADGESGAECYSFATTRDQARIVFDTAREMARRTPHLREEFGLVVGQHNIHIPAAAAKLEPKSSDADVLDGLNPHFACIDELHAHRTRALYDVTETSLAKRRNNLLWVITTAGADRAGVCYELHQHVKRTLDGTASDEAQFGLIYSTDAGDDWTTEAALAKANPNWRVSVQADTTKSLQAKAMGLPSAANSFRTKHLNEWVSARESWLDMRAWDACGDPALDMGALAGTPCWIGMDLAERTDMSSIAALFREIDDGGRPRYKAFCRHFLPRQTIERGENAHYRGWRDLGWVAESGDAMTDQAFIRSAVGEIADKHAVQGVLYDPAYASQLILQLQADGLPCVVMRPSILNFSDPMKELEALVLDRRLRHNGDPVLAWMAANVTARRDDKENIYPVKESRAAKIDGIVALIMALAAASKHDGGLAGRSVYEERGFAWV